MSQQKYTAKSSAKKQRINNYKISQSQKSASKFSQLKHSHVSKISQSVETQQIVLALCISKSFKCLPSHDITHNELSKVTDSLERNCEVLILINNMEFLFLVNMKHKNQLHEIGD